MMNKKFVDIKNREMVLLIKHSILDKEVASSKHASKAMIPFYIKDQVLKAIV